MPSRMEPEQGVRLQDIRNFTVQIRNPETEEIVGTGVFVTLQGGIITCAHVVEAALGIHCKDAIDATVKVYVPRELPEKRLQIAKIDCIFQDTDDDIVLLQVQPDLMLRPDQVASLGRAEQSRGNDFESYGYRQLQDFVGGWAYGMIQGSVEAPQNGTFLAEPVQLRSDQINAGMSGAAVLDRKRNLVIGLVSDTWFPDSSGKDRDTGWAVDGKILAFDPIALPLREYPLPLTPAPQPRTDRAAALKAVADDVGIEWNTAPDTVADWVGRTQLLSDISQDWADPQISITGLIGFGGEGKSSLARKWVVDLIENPELPQPKGVFWWGFYEKPNVEEFFEALLKYMTKGTIDATKITSVSTKAQIVGAMLANGRYLFILDGFEVMQFQSGDRFGETTSHPLAEFLTYIAGPDHESYALVTSRVQLHDLANYITYCEREVSRLSTPDGVSLLKALGCQGSEESLSALVENWDGHALTLKLLGSYITDRLNGDVLQASVIQPPTIKEHRYDRVHRVLRRYDEHLTAAETCLLMLICACRAPVPAWFAALPSAEDSPPDILYPLAQLDEEGLERIINRLQALRLLLHDQITDTLTVHPLIRSYYQKNLRSQGDQYEAVHLQLVVGYLTIIDLPIEDLLNPDENAVIPSIDDLPPLEQILPGVEAVFHACEAGKYEIGIIIHHSWIARGLSNYLSSRYGAHETELDICLNFFPDRDITQQPVYQSYQNKAAMAYLALGPLSSAIQLLRRNIDKRIQDEDWGNATMNCTPLSEAYVLAGDLNEAERWAQNSIAYLQKAIEQDDPRAEELKWKQYQFQADLAWILSLKGLYSDASELFKVAEDAAFMNEDQWGLLSSAAIKCAEHLLRLHVSTGILDFLESTRSVAEATARRNDLLAYQLTKAVILASLRDESAVQEFDLAMRYAESWGGLDDVVKAQIARGTFAARSESIELAYQDLNSALTTAVDANFKLYEIDTSIGLGWANFSEGNWEMAQDFAHRAWHESVERGYHWGEVDANELMHAIDEKIHNR